MDVAKLRNTFASRIRKLREGRFNQGEFADSVGISRGAMSYYEQELRTPDIGVLRAICVKYNISADYLLGIIPDPNHNISNVCHETGLSPESVHKLNIVTKLAATEFQSAEHLMGAFGDDFIDAYKLAIATSVPEVLNILLENEEGVSLLILLGAIILGAEVDGGGDSLAIKIKSASKNFQIELPVEDITPALWVHIQEHANKLRETVKGSGDIQK